jgi:hypothetical protein
MNKTLISALAVSASLLTSPARADTVVAAAEDSPETAETAGGPVHHWFAISTGLRNLWVLDPSFDPYAGDDRLTQATIAFDLRPVQLGPFGLGLTAEYDVGGRGATMRGARASIAVHRLALGAEARVELWRLELFARGTPAAIYADASVDDESFPRALDAGGWTWGVDATGGFRFRLGSAGRSDAPLARFWLSAEAGYAFAKAIDLRLSPAVDGDDPQAYGSVTLPSFQPRGVVNRIAFVVSF